MEAKDIKEGFLIHLHRYHLDFYSKKCSHLKGTLEYNLEKRA